MPRAKGSAKTGGRKKGTPNKRTQEFLDILEAEGFDPTRAVIETHRRAMKEFDRMDEVVDKMLDTVHEFKDLQDREKSDLIKKIYSYASTAPQYLRVAQCAATELLQYAVPKRKAIDLKIPDGDESKGGILVFMPSNGRERKAS